MPCHREEKNGENHKKVVEKLRKKDIAVNATVNASFSLLFSFYNLEKYL